MLEFNLSKMRKLYVLFHCSIALSFYLIGSMNVQAQSIFWSDNFDAPAGGANNNNAGAGWTLNSGGNGTNQWFINSGTSMGCSSSGNSLKISCTGFLCGFFGGPNEPVYSAAASNDRTAVSPNINTSGQSDLTLSFVFQCLGIANQDYGTVSLSSDGGTSWTDLDGRFESVSSCSTYTYALPNQYWNIPNLQIRFRWVESNAAAGADPAFNIDNIQITTPSQTCTPPTVDAGADVSICAGEDIDLGGDPTATGGSESGAFVYSWSPAAGLSSTTTANPTASPLTTTTYTVTVHRGTPACSSSDEITVTVNNPLPLTISADGPLTICPGDNVTLSASAGFSDFNWSLPGGGSASTATISANLIGSYELTAIGSNGCESSSNELEIEAGDAADIEVTANGPLSFCSGQSVTLTAATGFSNYIWSNGASGNSTVITEGGEYFVTAEGGACGGISDDVVVTVNVVEPMTVTPTGPLSVCQGETTTLEAEDGFSNYEWSNGETGQSLEVSSAGSFSVTAEDDNGCQVSSNSVNVIYLPVFTVGVTPSGVIDVCDGQSVTLVAESGYSNYTWSNNSTGSELTVNSSGLYSVSADNSQGCSGASNAVIVNFIDNQTASFTYEQTDEPIYTVEFTSTEVADEYLWDFGQGNTSTEPNPSYTFPFDGLYPVTLTIENSCGSNSVTIDVEVIKTSLNELTQVSGLEIYSAPNNGVFLSGETKSVENLVINIINVSGQIVYSENTSINGNFNKLIDLSSYSKGVYIIQINDSKSTMARKWVK